MKKTPTLEELTRVCEEAVKASGLGNTTEEVIAKALYLKYFASEDETPRTTWAYWVSFAHKRGFGRSSIKSQVPLNTKEIFEGVESKIALDHGLDEVCITNFILLEDKE